MAALQANMGWINAANGFSYRASLAQSQYRDRRLSARYWDSRINVKDIRTTNEFRNGKLRICFNCNTIKPLSEFVNLAVRNSRRGRLGHNVRCRTCQVATKNYTRDGYECDDFVVEDTDEESDEESEDEESEDEESDEESEDEESDEESEDEE
jgi:hypothetical protein